METSFKDIIWLTILAFAGGCFITWIFTMSGVFLGAMFVFRTKREPHEPLLPKIMAEKREKGVKHYRDPLGMQDEFMRKMQDIVSPLTGRREDTGEPDLYRMQTEFEKKFQADKDKERRKAS